jgi:hypothetical protein
VLGHAAENRRQVLNGIGGEGADAVPAVTLGEALRFLHAVRRRCESRSNAMRFPEREHNPFSDVGGCAKLPWFRRGLRFTVSLRTGVVFLGDRTAVRVVLGVNTAAVECGRKSAGILRIRFAAQKFFRR